MTRRVAVKDRLKAQLRQDNGGWLFSILGFWLRQLTLIDFVADTFDVLVPIEWRNGKSMIEGKSQCCVLSHTDGLVYVFGGYRNGDNASCYSYDPTDDKFKCVLSVLLFRACARGLICFWWQ